MSESATGSEAWPSPRVENPSLFWQRTQTAFNLARGAALHSPLFSCKKLWSFLPDHRTSPLTGVYVRIRARDFVSEGFHG